MSLPTAQGGGRGGRRGAGRKAGLGSILTTKGDLLVSDGTAPKRLTVGEDAQVLTADSTAPGGLAWAAGGGAQGPAGPTGPEGPAGPTGATGATGPAHVIEAGDIEYHDGTGAARLPVGTHGQTLQVDTSLAGKLKWVTVAAAVAAAGAFAATSAQAVLCYEGNCTAQLGILDVTSAQAVLALEGDYTAQLGIYGSSAGDLV